MGKKTISLPAGKSKVKVSFDDPVVASCRKVSPVLKMKMFRTRTAESIDVTLEQVSWHLAERTNKNGSKHLYLVGIPLREGVLEQFEAQFPTMTPSREEVQ
jgi:hypothetical protein